MNIVLVDHVERDHLLPLTFTRPVAKLRVGIFTIEEKWTNLAKAQVSYMTPDYLSKVFPTNLQSDNFFINAAIVPNEALVRAIGALDKGASLKKGELWIASRSSHYSSEMAESQTIESEEDFIHIDRAWKIFQNNGEALKQDLEWIRSQRASLPVPAGVTVIGDDLFIEEGAVIRPSIINTETGPVYIGKNAEVMEGALIRGGLALCDSATIKMGAKIYGPTTIGPHSKVGGEVGNSVILGYSNKGHEGYIGNTVLGEWCNLGADTNTSNLKNNYADVKVHNYALNRSENTGTQFCGLTMGDHAKSGINTMFNTGTVCGIFANVFGSDFPHRRIPDFGWGGASGFKKYRLNDALDVASKVMARRNKALTDDWREVYQHLFDQLSEKI